MLAHTDSGSLGLPALVLHGGAGTFEAVTNEEGAAVLRAALEQAADAGWAVLARGGLALDAVVETVASLEDSGRFNAGRGAVPTDDGTVELDASVMDGSSGLVGALCAATYPANPVRAARSIAGLRGVPDGPVLLAGAGADRYCEEAGLERMRPEWLRDYGRLDGGPRATGRVASEHGTVGAVAVDATGRVAAATSTGGRAGQRRGRVGDSPIPGAGVLAGEPGVAVSATGAGEAFLVAGFGFRVAASLEQGAGLAAALEEALAAVGRLGGSGGGIAIDPAGEFAAAFTTPAMARAWRGATGQVARLYPPGSGLAGP